MDPGISVAGFRNAAFNISAMAVWQQQEHDNECTGWARGTAQAIEPWSSNSGGYAQLYAGRRTDRSGARAAFGAAAFERLRALKRRFDPSNVLHRNQNVPPQTELPSAGAN